jgi:hypothetical protein
VPGSVAPGADQDEILATMLRLRIGELRTHTALVHAVASHVVAGCAYRRSINRPFVPAAEDALGLLSQLVTDVPDGKNGYLRWGPSADHERWIDAEAVLDVSYASPYHFLTRSRGYSKSADLAGIVIAVMATQAPIGAHLYGAAADRDQARLVLDSMQGYKLRTTELTDIITIKAYTVTCPLTFSVYEALPADGAGAYGLRPYFVVADEICQWEDTNTPLVLWEAITSALHKVPGSRMAVLSSAGDPAHWSKGIRDHAASHPLWHLHEIDGPPPWIDPVKLEEQRQRLPVSSFRRLFLNEWTASEDRLVTEADINGCTVLDGPQPLDTDTAYVFGLDVGLRNDRTVVSICHNELVAGRSYVVMDDMKVWQGTSESPVILHNVEDWIADKVTGSNPAAYHTVVYDPYQAVGLAQRLRERGVLSVEYPFTAQHISHLAMTMVRLLREHTIRLPVDPELRDELLNVRLKEPSPGYYRIDHDSSRHDDRVIALALAAQWLATKPAVSWATAWGYRECCGDIVPEKALCPRCLKLPDNTPDEFLP